MNRILRLVTLVTLTLLGACATRDMPERANESLADGSSEVQIAANESPTMANQETQDEPQAKKKSIVDELIPHRIPQVKTSAQTLTLETVLGSVDRHFPELLAARQEIERAEGVLLQAEGGFDPIVRGKGKFKRGFYDTEVMNIEIEQPTPTLGARVFGGYRIGNGNFASYNGGFETNTGGEFLFGVGLPILRGSAIDERRANLWRSRVERNAADPLVQHKRIAVINKASKAYWKWVAAGQQVRVVQGLLDLATTRQKSLRDGVAAGQFREISLTENERLVVVRKGLLVAAKREFERSALLLSLYFRNENGDALRAGVDSLPQAIPQVPLVATGDLENHIIYGISNRPELSLLAFARSQGEIDVNLSENKLLPKFDIEVFVSQDVGRSISPKSEFVPLEAGVGLSLEVPLRRRNARGKLQQARAKLTKIGHQYRMQADRIEAEVRDAASALTRARQRVELARQDLVLAQKMQSAERIALNEGASDLLRLNIREQATAKAQATLIKFEAECLIDFAEYAAAVGLPLAEQ